MRLPVLFLAIHLVVLALFPCQDLPASASCAAVASDIPADQDAPAHHDECTPFCSCACCGTLVATLPYATAARVLPPHPPAGQTRPQYTPTWNPLLVTTRLTQPPRS